MSALESLKNLRSLKILNYIYNDNETHRVSSPTIKKYLESGEYKDLIKDELVVCVNSNNLEYLMALEPEPYGFVTHLKAETIFSTKLAKSNHNTFCVMNRKDIEYFNQDVGSHIYQLVTSICLYNNYGLFLLENKRENDAYTTKKLSYIQGHLTLDRDCPLDYIYKYISYIPPYKYISMRDFLASNMTKEILEEVAFETVDGNSSIDKFIKSQIKYCMSDSYCGTIKTISTQSDKRHLCCLFCLKLDDTFDDKRYIMTSLEEKSIARFLPWEDIPGNLEYLCPWVINSMSKLSVFNKYSESILGISKNSDN